MAQFYEVFRCLGVDEGANPPAMLVKAGESSLVALADGVGFSVGPRDKGSGVNVNPILDPRDLLAARDDLHNYLTQQGVDPKLREGLMPDLVISWTGITRYFEVSADRRVEPPVFVDARSNGKSHKLDATLRVAVVDKKPIKLDIRNLKVRNGAGDLVEHATRPSVPDEDVAGINTIWTSQTNIEFGLGPSDPIIIDVKDDKTRAELRKAFDLKDDASVQIGEVIDPNKLVGVIANRIQPSSADFTIIVVKKAIDLDKKIVNGITIPSGRFAVVTDSREFITMAHEVGHFIGGHASKNGWVDWPDLDTNDVRLLMRKGGAGFKIPFDFAMQCRKFPTKSSHPETNRYEPPK